MSLSDLASLGSFVSGIAVLVSLGILYFQLRQINRQIRQAEKNQQASIRQERTRRSVDVMLSATEPSLSEAWGKALNGAEELSAAALQQFTAYWRAGFLGWEDAFDQHQGGLFTDQAFATLERYVRASMGAVGTRAQWRRARAWYGVAFVAWMDKIVAETPILENIDLMDNWRKDVRAERSGARY